MDRLSNCLRTSVLQKLDRIKRNRRIPTLSREPSSSACSTALTSVGLPEESSDNIREGFEGVHTQVSCAANSAGDLTLRTTAGHFR